MAPATCSTHINFCRPYFVRFFVFQHENIFVLQHENISCCQQPFLIRYWVALSSRSSPDHIERRGVTWRPASQPLDPALNCVMGARLFYPQNIQTTRSSSTPIFVRLEPRDRSKETVAKSGCGGACEKWHYLRSEIIEMFEHAFPPYPATHNMQLVVGGDAVMARSLLFPS